MDIRIKKLINIWVHFKFEVCEFEVLFPDDEKMDKLRNELLSDFFANINDLYWNSFFITIARLLDSYNHGSNINLSLFTLPEILKENKIEWITINDKIKSLKEKYKDITSYRSKLLVHFDINYSIGKRVFNTSTHINEINSFLNEMLSIINDTLKALGSKEESGLIMYPYQYQGSAELLRILANEQKNREGIRLK